MSGLLEIVMRLRDKISSPAGRINTSLGKMQRQSRALSRDMTRLGGALGHMSAGLAAVMSVRKFADFEQSLANVSTMLDNSAEHLGRFRDGIETLSTEIGESAESLAGGLYDILSASIAPSQALDVLAVSAKAAKAGMSDTKTAADAITTVLNSYGMSAERAAEVSDFLFSVVRRGKTTFGELAPNIGKVSSLAASAGLNLDQFGATIALLTRNGVKTENALTAIQAVLSSILKPASESAAAARELGVQIDMARLQADGLHGILRDLAGLPPDTLAKLFPNVRALRGILPALNSLEDFGEDIDAMAGKAGATEAAYEKMASTTATGFARLRAQAERTARTLGEALAQPAGDSGAAALKLVEQLANGFAALVRWAQQFAAAHPGLAGALLGLLSAIGKLAAVMVAVAAAAKAWSVLSRVSRTLTTMRQSTTRAIGSIRTLGAASDQTAGGLARLRSRLAGMRGSLRALGNAAANIGFAVIIAQVWDLVTAVREAEAAADDLLAAFAAGDWETQADAIAKLRDELSQLGESWSVKYNPVAMSELRDAQRDLVEIEETLAEQRADNQRALENMIRAPQRLTKKTGDAYEFLAARAQAAESAMQATGDATEALAIATGETSEDILRLVDEFGLGRDAALALARAYDEQSEAASGTRGQREEYLRQLIEAREAQRRLTQMQGESAKLEQERLAALGDLRARVDEAMTSALEGAAEDRRKAIDEVVAAWDRSQEADRTLTDRLSRAQQQRTEAMHRIAGHTAAVVSVIESISPRVAAAVEDHGVGAARDLIGDLEGLGAEGRAQIERYLVEIRRLEDERRRIRAAFDAHESQLRDEQEAERQRSTAALRAWRAEVAQVETDLQDRLGEIEATQGVERLNRAFAAGEIAAGAYIDRLSQMRMGDLGAQAENLRTRLTAAEESLRSIGDQETDADSRRAALRERILHLTESLADVEATRAQIAADIDSARHDAAQKTMERLSAQRQELQQLLQQLDAQVATGSISSAEAMEIADEATAQFQKRLTAARAELLALLEGDPAAAARLQAQLQALNTGFPQLETRMQRFGREAQRLASGPLENFFESLLTDMSDVKGAFRSLLDDMAAAIRRWVAQQMVLKFFSMFAAGPTAPAAGAAGGGLGFASGGLVPGPRIDRDIVSAWLTPGEYVIPRDRVAQYGLGFLEAIRRGVAPAPSTRASAPAIGRASAAYNSGGRVEPAPAASGPSILPVQVTSERQLSHLLTGNRAATRRILSDLGVQLRR